MEALAVHLAEVNHVDVCLVYTLEVADSGVETKWLSTVDACDSDTISWLHLVYQVVVSVEKDSVWGLARWHVLWEDNQIRK